MALTEEQLAFVETFITKAAPALETVAGDAGAPIGYWRAGKEAADKSITALQSSLRSIGHPDLTQIAEFGLNAVTQGNQTALTAALMDYAKSSAESRAAAGQTLAAQVSAYRDFLGGNEIITLCEENPFGVSVDIRGPLGAALDRIEAAISG